MTASGFPPRAALICLLLPLISCASPRAGVTRTLDLAYARCSLTLGDHADEAIFAACFSRIEGILRSLDMYNDQSEVSAVNRAAGVRPVAVSAETIQVLRQGLSLAERTGGRFDPTVGPLVRLWGISGSNPRVPSSAEIDAARALVDWKKVSVDEKARTVFLERPGMSLDFGALLKGFAAVEAGRLLSARGVTSAIAEIGGSVIALGSSPRGGPWRVGVQEPGAPNGTFVGLLRVRDAVVNTSGLYEQFFIADGKRYAHILDTRTGYPVANGVDAVVVIRDRLQNADGPSLAILALGPEEGLALAERLGVDALIIGADRTLRMTDGARRRFELLDRSYRIVSP